MPGARDVGRAPAVAGLGLGQLDELEHLRSAELGDLDRAHRRPARLPLARPHDPHRRRIHRLSTPSRPRSGSASGCSAAPATHFALASSFFDEVRVVGPVGDDFGEAEYGVLRTRGVDHRRHRARPGRQDVLLAGRLRARPQHAARRSTPTSTSSSTSSRSCREASRDCDVLFLANIQPDLQRGVREQCDGAQLRRDGLDEPVDRHRARRRCAQTIATVDCLILNDEELEQLTEQAEPRRAPPARC